MEIWKDIEGFEGVYQVSNLGRVKSLNRYRKYRDNIPNSLALVKGKMLKGKIDKDGYLEYTLSKDGKLKSYRAHRLVAQAFIPNPNNLPQVNHRNEDKTDNRVDNLEWCSAQYNAEYSKAKAILQFDENLNFLGKWKSCAEVERQLGLDHSSIQKCCVGKNKSRGGFKWGYEKDYEKIPFKVFDLELYRKKVA